MKIINKFIGFLKNLFTEDDQEVKDFKRLIKVSHNLVSFSFQRYETGYSTNALILMVAKELTRLGVKVDYECDKTRKLTVIHLTEYVRERLADIEEFLVDELTNGDKLTLVEVMIIDDKINFVLLKEKYKTVKE